MPYKYVTASGTVWTGGAKLTSIMCSPLVAAQTLWSFIAYDDTAGSSIMVYANSSSDATIVWHDPEGVQVENLYLGVYSSIATITWE